MSTTNKLMGTTAPFTNGTERMGAVTLHPLGGPVIVFDMSWGVPSLKAVEEVIARHKLVPDEIDEIRLTAELVEEALDIDKAAGKQQPTNHRDPSGAEARAFYRREYAHALKQAKERLAMAFAYQPLWLKLERDHLNALRGALDPTSIDLLEDLVFNAPILEKAIYEWVYGGSNETML
jgi:hypothetical protein